MGNLDFYQIQTCLGRFSLLVWDRQWKSRRSGSAKIGPREVPGGAPRESLISKQFLMLFHCLSDFRLQKPKRMCPAGVV